jgi:glycosyltransferase involved in cell wall biosynthesis
VDVSLPFNGEVIVVGPSLESHGGIASVNRTLSEANFFGLGADGLDVQLRTSTRDGSIFSRTAYALGNLVRFAIARRRSPWTLHAHMAFQGSFWRKAAYGWVTHARGGRVIYHIHPCDFWDYYEQGGQLRRAAIRATLTRANAVIVITNSMKEKLGRIAPDVPRFVVRNPINLDRTSEPAPRDPATIVFLGWLVPNKGVFELVDAVARLRETIPALKLVFAGSKDDGRLRAHVVRSGLSDVVEFPGWLEPNRVVALLGRATVFALPSYSEGVPMAMLEALACGTPIVATRVGGIPEILQNERHGLLIAPRDVEGLTAALIRLLQDRELRERMSLANREAARAFDVGGTATALRSIYRTVLFPERAAS